MLPMNHTQIRFFAEQSGVNDAAGFLNEVGRENAWAFAVRPLDLNALITSWKKQGVSALGHSSIGRRAPG